MDALTETRLPAAPKMKTVDHPPLSTDREIGGAIPQSQGEAVVTTKTTAIVGKSWAHFIAGGTGGMVSATLTSPFDVIKTRLQGDFYVGRLKNTGFKSGGIVHGIKGHVNETFELLREIYRAEGPKALFKGLGPNLIGVVPARAINFYTYGNGKRIIATEFNDGKEATWVHLSAAAIAGIVTGTATNPIWLVKTRLQLDKERSAKTKTGRRYVNSLDCIRQTVRMEGYRGLYKGLSASYLGVSESTIQWVLYERMKMALHRREQRRIDSGRPETTWDQVVEWSGKLGAAGSAKLLATAATYPHEVVRTRLRQAPMQDGQPKYKGLGHCFRLILKEEGVGAMYGGMVSHIFKVVPSAAIMFGTYEVILRMMGTDLALEKPTKKLEGDKL